MNVFIVNDCIYNLTLLIYSEQLWEIKNIHINYSYFTIIKINYCNYNDLIKVHDYMFVIVFWISPLCAYSYSNWKF